MKNQPTYREIATKAGVSVVAVHFALRNKPGVSEKTRKAVLKAATECGYRPNPFVSALMARLSSSRPRKLQAILGIFTHSPMTKKNYEHSTPSEYLAGASEMANSQGFLLEQFCWSDFDSNETLVKRVLRSRRIAGVLFHPADGDMIPSWCALDWSSYALGAVADHRELTSLDFACTDHYQNLFLAVEGLRKLGHTRIGFISTIKDIDPSHTHALSAYLTWSAVTFPPGKQIPPLLTQGWYPENNRPWLKQFKPTAILTDDHLVRDWLEKNSYSIPRDISYAHLDVDERWVNVAGIKQHNFEVGAIAMQCVIDHIYRNNLGFPAHPKTYLGMRNLLPSVCSTCSARILFSGSV